LTAEAVAGDEIRDETLEKLRQLSELDASLPRLSAPPARRWPVILICLGVFLVPGIMISLKVPTVEVQLSLLVSELSWTQAQGGQVMGKVDLKSLSARSFDTIELPQTREAPKEKLTEPPANFCASGACNGRISLKSAHADSNSKVSISGTAGESVLSLSMLGPKTKAEAILSGSVDIDSGGRRQRDFGRGRSVALAAADPRPLDLDLRFGADPDVSFPAHIAIAGLSLQKLEYVVIGGLRTTRKVSTVLEGDIFNQSMNDKRHNLRKGEALMVDGVEGEIRSMRVTAKGIRLDYHGKVTNISVGSSNNPRSLMPNWLEWFSERHGVKLLWGAFLWLTTTLFGVIEWWRKE